MIKYLILGAGPTGLGAAYRLKELGETDFLVLDRENHVGGLASSFLDERGFTWDIGGHVQFSHYHYFDSVMQKALGAEDWLLHERESWAWMEGRFIPYPVQNNIRYLTRDSMWKSLEGLISVYEKKPYGEPKNFREWILNTFGGGLAQIFMLPYNFKVWAYPAEKMGFGWIGERVAVTDLKRVTQNILFGLDDLSWGPNQTFQFPKRGGTGQIWKNVAALIGSENFSLSQEITEVDIEKSEVRTKDGNRYSFGNVMSTLPLNVLCGKIVPGLPEGVRKAAREFTHSTSHIVGLGLRGNPPERLRKKCWMYFPEEDCPFYRVTVFSNYSPNNVPDSRIHWSLMTETSESDDKPVDRSKLIEETILGCLNTGLISERSEIISTWMHTAEYGYPTPTPGRDEAINTLFPILEKSSIFSRGRFGAWKYEVSNQDHSFMQGVEWADRMVLGIPETTVFFPGVVNANGKR